MPVDAQAAHLRELRDAYGPIPPEALIDAMIRSQDRTDRVSRVLLTWRGNADCLARDGAAPPSVPAAWPRRRPWAGRC